MPAGAPASPPRDASTDSAPFRPAASEALLPLPVVPREEGELMCPAGAGFRPQPRPPETAYEVLAHLI